MLKNDILNELEKNKGSYISGGSLASTFGVSRTAIWKSINSLKESGFKIETVSGRGYMLSSDDDKIAVEGISNHLAVDTDIYYLDEIDSTNSYAMKLISDNNVNTALVVANHQLKGKGRRGRNFSSPKDNGIYMSIVLPGKISIDKSLLSTTAASVAVVNAIREVTGKETQIKWVNDIFYENKKVAGILTEAVTDFEMGCINNIIIGIGINCYSDYIPTELQDVAGSLTDTQNAPIDRNKLIAFIANNLFKLYDNISSGDFSFMNEYRKSSMVIGKNIKIFKSTAIVSENGIKAKAIDISDNGALVVEYPDGSQETISTGEISIRLD